MNVHVPANHGTSTNVWYVVHKPLQDFVKQSEHYQQQTFYICLQNCTDRYGLHVLICTGSMYTVYV